jgi:hypothetical protein
MPSDGLVKKATPNGYAPALHVFSPSTGVRFMLCILSGQPCVHARMRSRLGMSRTKAFVLGLANAHPNCEPKRLAENAAPSGL